MKGSHTLTLITSVDKFLCHRSLAHCGPLSSRASCFIHLPPCCDNGFLRTLLRKNTWPPTMTSTWCSASHPQVCDIFSKHRQETSGDFTRSCTMIILWSMSSSRPCSSTRANRSRPFWNSHDILFSVDLPVLSLAYATV